MVDEGDVQETLSVVSGFEVRDIAEGYRYSFQMHCVAFIVLLFDFL